MTSHRTTEDNFKNAALAAGFDIQPSPSIRSPYPVTDKHGDESKVVTQPDWYVVNPQTGKGMYVEVTNGNGSTEHKAAQLRVARAAGVENYQVVTGDQVEILHRLKSRKDKRTFLMALFGWLLLI